MTRLVRSNQIDRLHEHARVFLEIGFALLPIWPVLQRDGRIRCGCGDIACASPGKHPIGRLAPNGVHSATFDARRVDDWFDHGPINLGIACGPESGVVALDVDPRNGGDETLAELEQTRGALPATWRFLTGGGGEHILFRHPGRAIANSASSLGRGLDLKGDGGYIVAPPSRHQSGRTYEISVDHHPDEVQLANAPTWVLGPPAGSAAIGSISGPTDWPRFTRTDIVEGGRNSELSRLAGHLLRRWTDPHVVLDLLLGFNALRCKPPLGEAEVLGIVASIARREHRRRRGR